MAELITTTRQTQRGILAARVDYSEEHVAVVVLVAFAPRIPLADIAYNVILAPADYVLVEIVYRYDALYRSAGYVAGGIKLAGEN